MNQVKSTTFYIEEYENESGQLSAGLREKPRVEKSTWVPAEASKTSFGSSVARIPRNPHP